jgi:acyl carrier protein
MCPPCSPAIQLRKLSVSSLHDELAVALGTWNASLSGQCRRDTSLVASGRLDSTALLQLVLWIEQKIGRPIDATAVDIPTEWDSIDAIVTYVERERRNA